MLPDDSETRMRSMVGEHFRFVAHALRRAGVPPPDLDDEIQRTFIVASRRLDTTPPADERKFLFGVAANIALHARRRLARRREVPAEEIPDRADLLGTPEHLVERKRLRELVARILGKMEEPLRVVLTLYALEEMKLTDIAARLAIPRGTVMSRLRRARARFRDHLVATDVEWGCTASGSPRVGRPVLSLLQAGASAVDFAATRAHMLAALGRNEGTTGTLYDDEGDSYDYWAGR